MGAPTERRPVFGPESARWGNRQDGGLAKVRFPSISLEEIKNRRFEVVPMELDPQVKQAFRALLDTIGEDFPRLQDILETAQAGLLSEEDALEQMALLVQGNPDLAAKLTEQAQTALAPLRGQEGLVVPDHDPQVIYDNQVGLPRLNPLYEAALIERLQYDGDLPQARTGPLAPGIKPAVPVDTDARSLVAIGHMLEDASNKVAEEVKEARQKHLDEVQALPEAKTVPKKGTLVPKKGTDLAVAARGDASADPPSYRRGELPALYKVVTPSGSALALLEPEERRQRAWKAFSTTQGRRTAAPTIWKLVAEALRKAGMDVPDDHGGKEEEELEILATAEWTMHLGEQGTTQENFSLLDVAARALVLDLLSQLESPGVDLLGLEVNPINTVSERSVGWSARLVR